MVDNVLFLIVKSSFVKIRLKFYVFFENFNR